MAYVTYVTSLLTVSLEVDCAGKHTSTVKGTGAGLRASTPPLFSLNHALFDDYGK
jgi:hypothetical protein